jgi:hypothetical protein
MVAAQAGVTKSVPPGERVSGYPARKHSAAKRHYVLMEHLPKLVGSVRGLESRISKLEDAVERGGAASAPSGGRTGHGVERPDEEV